MPADDAVVPTLTGVYPGTEFPEREVYGLLGPGSGTGGAAGPGAASPPSGSLE